jgi:hypothetical protein
MHLNDKHLAWMHKMGVTRMSFDREGNVLEIHVREWLGNDALLAEPEAPAPPPLVEPTQEEIEKQERLRARRIAAADAALRNEAYRQMTGLDLDPEQPQ